MRPIKFRAWDKNKNRWLTCDEYEAIRINPLLDSEGNGFDLYDSTDMPDVEWVEFTGLHDKNGREIYEESILIIFGGPIGRVLWDKENAGFYIECKEINFDFSALNPEDIEEIGNTFENKDLLNDSK